MNNKENTNKMVKDECINHIHLIDVANVLYGYPLQAKNFCEDSSYLPVVRIRDIKAGFSTTYYRESVPMEYIVHLGDILVGMDGEFNLSKWRSREAILNQRVCKIESKDESIILNQYLFHLLGPIFKKIEKNIQGSTVKHLSAKIINSIKIPLPPLPIQQEIVRILDTFTNLTAELTAELTARRKQYEYYRDELLTFGEDVPRVQLGNIGPVCMCKRILKSQTNTVGGVPFYKIGTFGKTANAYISEETYQEYRSMYSFPNKGDILISAAGTIGRTVVYDGKPAYFQDSNIVWIANDETRVLNRFLAYCYEKKPWNISTGGTIARLYNENIQKAVIPAPSLERQMQIVSQLEKMEDLCNSITVGLPAEITARQKQYEYYRDQLLTFKRIGG